jgi:hypothetical protein
MAGWNFRKAFNLGKSFRLNVGSRSLGVSFGIKGARIEINTKRGMYSDLRIPGTGLYNRSYFGGRRQGTGPEHTFTTAASTTCRQCGATLLKGAKFCSMCGSAA